MFVNIFITSLSICLTLLNGKRAESVIL